MVRRKLINTTGNKSQRKFDYQELAEKDVLEISPLEVSPGDGDTIILESDVAFNAGDVVVIGFYAKSGRDFRTTLHFAINGTESVKWDPNLNSLTWSSHLYIVVKSVPVGIYIEFLNGFSTIYCEM